MPAVVILAVAAFTGWWLFGPEPRVTLALTAFIGVVIVACPCAMGLATPTAIMVGTGRGAEAGILFRGGEALEAASHVSIVAFDKTGTLTAGRPEVVAVEPASGVDPAALIDLAASLERASEHPLGAAIVVRAKHDELGFRAVEAFESLPGLGVEGRVDGQDVLVGSGRLLAERGIDTTPLDADAARLAGAGRSVAWVAIDGAVAGVLAIADPVKPEAAEAIRRLADAGHESWLIPVESRRSIKT